MLRHHKIVLLLNDAADLRPLCRTTGNPDAWAAAISLAKAIAVSPPFAYLKDAVVVIRPGPSPLIAVMGDLGAENEQRLLQLRWQIERLLPTIRYVDYSTAERQCVVLADKLTETFGRNEIEGFCFTALPRGGHIVLGMLAYALQLDPAQLAPPYSSDRTLVVVDDCAISGAVFGKLLPTLPDRRIIFAHLYSHPELRSAILAREPQVAGCVSAADLKDIAPVLHGADYPAWKRRWQARMDPAAYWVGQPEYVAFAWNEPDMWFWNPAAGTVERGWYLLSPALCLKNRFVPAGRGERIQIQAIGPGPQRAADDVLFADYRGGVIVGNVRTEECFFLRGSEAEIWSAVVRLGAIDAVISAMSAEYAVDGETLRHDVRAFIEHLQSAGLLVDSDEAATNVAL